MPLSTTLYPPWTVNFIHLNLFHPPWPISSTMTYFIHHDIFHPSIMTYFLCHDLFNSSWPISSIMIWFTHPVYPPWPTFKSVNHPSLTSTGIVSLCRGRGDRRSRLNLIPLSTVLNCGSGFSSRYPQWKSTAFSFFFILMVPNPVQPSYGLKDKIVWKIKITISLKYIRIRLYKKMNKA